MAAALAAPPAPAACPGSEALRAERDAARASVEWVIRYATEDEDRDVGWDRGDDVHGELMDQVRELNARGDEWEEEAEEAAGRADRAESKVTALAAERDALRVRAASLEAMLRRWVAMFSGCTCNFGPEGGPPCAACQSRDLLVANALLAPPADAGAGK